MSFVTLEHRGPVGLITMNRPEALNALNDQVLRELDAVLDQVEADDSILVAVITGAGRSFVAGADIGQMSTLTAAEGKAVVMVLHDLNLALGCAHRVAVMEEGRLRAWGTPAEIYAGGALEQVFGVKVHRTELEDGTEQYLFTRRGP